MSSNIKNKTRNRSYPRSTVKKIIKGHSDKNVGRNVDALVRTGHRRNVAQPLRSPQQVYIDYVLFIQESVSSRLQRVEHLSADPG